jgi:GlpG protein
LAGRKIKAFVTHFPVPWPDRSMTLGATVQPGEGSMRQIGTLSDEAQAVTLAEYLLTLHIETRLEQEPHGWVVWVCDEDRVAQGRQELEAFQRNPYDPRYAAAIETLRRRVVTPVDAPRPSAEPADAEAVAPERRGRSWTFALLAACVAVGLATNLGEEKDQPQPLLRALLISDSRSGMLPEVRHGQVWRLVTPIFLHFGPLHLLFNMLFFFRIGALVEERRGPLRYLGLVLLLAVVSNLTQYFLGHPARLLGREDGPLFNPAFGGLSGVLYGLFGYVWVKGRLEPELDLDVNPTTTLVLMLWFFLCLTSVVPNVGNGSHAGGLLTGALVGAVPPLWRSAWIREDQGPSEGG